MDTPRRHSSRTSVRHPQWQRRRRRSSCLHVRQAQSRSFLVCSRLRLTARSRPLARSGSRARQILSTSSRSPVGGVGTSVARSLKHPARRPAREIRGAAVMQKRYLQGKRRIFADFSQEKVCSARIPAGMTGPGRPAKKLHEHVEDGTFRAREHEHLLDERLTPYIPHELRLIQARFRRSTKARDAPADRSRV
jgi:hypothetical protein